MGKFMYLDVAQPSTRAEDVFDAVLRKAQLETQANMEEARLRQQQLQARIQQEELRAERRARSLRESAERNIDRARIEQQRDAAKMTAERLSATEAEQTRQFNVSQQWKEGEAAKKLAAEEQERKAYAATVARMTGGGQEAVPAGPAGQGGFWGAAAPGAPFLGGAAELARAAPVAPALAEAGEESPQTIAARRLRELDQEAEFGLAPGVTQAQRLDILRDRARERRQILAATPAAQRIWEEKHQEANLLRGIHAAVTPDELAGISTAPAMQTLSPSAVERAAAAVARKTSEFEQRGRKQRGMKETAILQGIREAGTLRELDAIAGAPSTQGLEAAELGRVSAATDKRRGQLLERTGAEFLRLARSAESRTQISMVRARFRDAPLPVEAVNRAETELDKKEAQLVLQEVLPSIRAAETANAVHEIVSKTIRSSDAGRRNAATLRAAGGERVAEFAATAGERKQAAAEARAAEQQLFALRDRWTKDQTEIWHRIMSESVKPTDPLNLVQLGRRSAEYVQNQAAAYLERGYTADHFVERLLEEQHLAATYAISAVGYAVPETLGGVQFIGLEDYARAWYNALAKIPR